MRQQIETDTCHVCGGERIVGEELDNPADGCHWLRLFCARCKIGVWRVLP